MPEQSINLLLGAGFTALSLWLRGRAYIANRMNYKKNEDTLINFNGAHRRAISGMLESGFSQGINYYLIPYSIAFGGGGLLVASILSGNATLAEISAIPAGFHALEGLIKWPPFHLKKSKTP